MTSLGTGGMITRITTGKIWEVKCINEQPFFAHFQTGDCSGFINITEIRLTDKINISDLAMGELSK